MITLTDILQSLTGNNYDAPSIMISDAFIDSRQVTPSSMFVAIPGERTDGHNFINDAFKRGATIALIENKIADHFQTIDLRNRALNERFTMPQTPVCLRVDNSLAALQEIARFRRRQADIRVIGITGSVGKSTTKELVAGVLRQRYRTLKNRGNYNNEIGLPLSILRLGYGHQSMVLEMGFYQAGEIEFLCDIALPQIGVLTNIGKVHAERAGSQEAIARGKAELVKALPPDPDGIAVLNYDDPLVRQMAGDTEARIFYYGLTPAADLWASDVEGMGLEGIRFKVHFRNEILHLRVPMIGHHSVHTALRAIAVGLVEGLTWHEIATGLRQSQSQLRLVAVHSSIGALLLDDTYNASPASMQAALKMLGDMEGRKIAVVGDMMELGQYEKQSHEMIGSRAAEVCCKLVAVGKRGKMIADGAAKAGLKTSAITWIPEVTDVIGHLRDQLRKGDVVLVKGGHSLRMDRIVTALENYSPSNGQVEKN